MQKRANNVRPLARKMEPRNPFDTTFGRPRPSVGIVECGLTDMGTNNRRQNLSAAKLANESERMGFIMVVAKR